MTSSQEVFGCLLGGSSQSVSSWDHPHLQANYGEGFLKNFILLMVQKSAKQLRLIVDGF